ncbi:MAG: DNA gyrase subunit A [Parcubacteria group bacterium]|nr:DNA gyrase subunit A [Parcubacteria group bacterium]
MPEINKEEFKKNIEPREITEELRESYLDYAMSVIIARALPDARDGLKPVQRRILYAMNELGLTANSKTRKSATVVGETLGKFHPHGDIAVYDALVRMAQDFSLRYPLIQGQGNFGSIDGDPPGAMRYTECRLTNIAQEMLEDLDKETVDFMPNYDGTRQEPKYLPAKLPQLILNGAMGIAVGMATNIPPHNLTEIANAINFLIDKPDASTEELMNFIKGPDFPTGGIIYGKESILEAYATGKGSIICRAKTEIIDDNKHKKIIVTEIPYQVNKADLITKIAALVEENKIEGIKDLRDESDKEGLRIAIDLHQNALPNRILNLLFKYTEMEKAFHVNILALVENGLQPKVLSLKNILEEYLEHRKEVIKRRTEYLLKKAKERIHILEGLAQALNHIDEIIKLIKSSENRDNAQQKLMAKYKFSEIQANAILEMKLSNLAKLEKQKVEDELKEKQKLASEYEIILKQPKRILKIIKDEINYLKEKYGDERKTKIEPYLPGEIKDEELIPAKDILITLSQTGYIKRMSPETLKAQKRGGKGVIGYETKNEEDAISHLLAADNRDKILFFTNKGYLFQIPAFEIAEGSRTSRGKLIQNYLNLREQEKVIVLLNLPPHLKETNYRFLILATQQGLIKKTALKEYDNIRKGGIVAIKLTNNDNVIGATFSTGNDEILLISEQGQAIRFSEKEIRALGRTASGVKGIKLKNNDRVVSLINITPEIIKVNPQVLVMSEKGFGKRTKLNEYRQQKRGGSGIKTAKITNKTGLIIKAALTQNEETLIAISQKAQIIKAQLKSVPILRRTTQGVRIMKLTDDDKIAGFSLI